MPRRRYAMRTSFQPPVAEPVGQRELVAVREIGHAFLRADRPEDAFQFALDRVTPVVGASFASVYLTDGASEVMRLVAAHNWPERHRPWLGEARVRVGFGPSGEAASERRAIEIPDVFSDPDLEDWHEVARELGFRAIVAIPLQTNARVLGTVTFYFSDLTGFTPERRGLLRIVADQMAAMAEKLLLTDELRRVNAVLVETNAELERQYLAVADVAREKDEFLASIAHELERPMQALAAHLDGLAGRQTSATGAERDEIMGAAATAERLVALTDAVLALTALERGTLVVTNDRFDPRLPLRDAMRAATGVPAGVQLIAEEPVYELPVITSDREKIRRILVSLLVSAFQQVTTTEVRASVRVANERVEYCVYDAGTGDVPGDGGTRLQLTLARGLARLLGGDIDVASAPGRGTMFRFFLPVANEPTGDHS